MVQGDAKREQSSLESIIWFVDDKQGTTQMEKEVNNAQAT